MRRFRLDRRAALRGAGGIAIGLPWLEIMGCGRAPGAAMGQVAQRAVAPAKRFVAFYTPNGNILSNWKPIGTETDFMFGPILAPLTPFKSDLLVIDGLHMVNVEQGPGDPHQKGMAWLTGHQLLPGDHIGNDGVSRAGYPVGISLDQSIAASIGNSTKFRSLEFAVQLEGSDVMHRMSYLDGGQPVPPEENPRAAFDRIFAGLTEGGDGGDVLARRRVTVLDAVTGDYDRLRAKLGAEDRRKVEAHLSSIREIEARLSQGVDTSGTCAPKAPPTGISLDAHTSFPEIGKLQMDLLAMALTCDMTRVASLLWAGARNRRVFSWLGFNEEHHSLSHTSSTDAAMQEKLQQVHAWYSEQFAYLLGKLKAVREGEGTLLDSTVILWGTDVAYGNVHSHGPMPFVLAGSAQKSLRTGRQVTFPDMTPHNNLLVSLLNVMGIEATTFGRADACTGPLTGLT